MNTFIAPGLVGHAGSDSGTHSAREWLTHRRSRHSHRARLDEIHPGRRAR
jgi:hypothetical protein